MLANVGGVDLRNNVTLFTASDFGRTITTNGDGTDHGWGGHHFVLGGAVKGGEIYGRFPIFGLNNNQDSANNAYLPVTSVDTIGSTLGRWFGVSDANLDTVFPNLKQLPARPRLPEAGLSPAPTPRSALGCRSAASAARQRAPVLDRLGDVRHLRSSSLPARSAIVRATRRTR